MSNLSELTLNINQIAELVGMHRQTVSQRLSSLTPTTGSNPKLKLYKLSDLIRHGISEKMVTDVDSLSPADRRAYWQAENERLKYEERTRELIPVNEVSLEMGTMAKAIVQTLETLPDILERDAGLSPHALIRVQQIIDDLRDQLSHNVAIAQVEEQE